MVTADGARNIVGIIGNVISFGLFLSPSPTFIHIIRKRSTEEFSPYPYLATFLNCMMWVFYGTPFVHPNSLLVITINGIGMGLELTYLIIFFVFGNNRQRLKVILVLVLELIFMGVVVALVIIFAHTFTKRSMIVGIMCVVFGTLMYGSPLVVMKKVITTKSVQYMPLYLSLASFLNGVCWTAYALIKFDLFMLIPNGMGALLGAGQLILYACYCRSTPKDEKPHAVQMSSIP